MPHVADALALDPIVLHARDEPRQLDHPRDRCAGRQDGQFGDAAASPRSSSATASGKS